MSRNKINTNELIAKRQNMGLTQDELAKKVGCNQQHISDIENGKKSPSIYLLSKLAQVFECMIDDLVAKE
jgi:DNA-binding XRE family transcriptional regulator